MSDETRDELDGEWNKAQRLAVAGMVAPHLRDQAERASKRRVAKVDKDGNVVGYTTLAEVQKALLLERQIELEVVDGTRPKDVVCEGCGGLVAVKPIGAVPKFCVNCVNLTCRVCGEKTSSATSLVALRTGAPPRCFSCRTKYEERPCSTPGCIEKVTRQGVGYWTRRAKPPICRTCGLARRRELAVERCKEMCVMNAKKSPEQRHKEAVQRARGAAKTNAKLITFRGETMSLTDWAKRAGCTINTLRWRLANWSIERALTSSPDRVRGRRKTRPKS